jgi:serine/threonine protein kinase
LSTLHNCNIIHGSVKPSSIFIQADNTAMLGELGRVEAEAARLTTSSYSKILIADAMPHTLVYWSPELLAAPQHEKLTTAGDMWALGVTMYQVVTGEHPFTTEDEQTFRKEVYNGWVDYSRLAGHPRLKIIIENLLKVDPQSRWDANLVLVQAQQDFIVDIQRLFRGFQARQEVKRLQRGLVKIQALMKGRVTRNRYQKQKGLRKEQAATMIQSRWRAYIVRSDYIKKLHSI